MEIETDDLEKRKAGVFDLYITACEKIEQLKKQGEIFARMLEKNKEFIEEWESQKQEMLRFLEIK